MKTFLVPFNPLPCCLRSDCPTHSSSAGVFAICLSDRQKVSPPNQIHLRCLINRSTFHRWSALNEALRLKILINSKLEASELFFAVICNLAVITKLEFTRPNLAGWYASIFQAKFAAISAETFALLNRENVGNTIRFILDSQVAIKAITALNTTSQVVAETSIVFSKGISFNNGWLWTCGGYYFWRLEEVRLKQVYMKFISWQDCTSCRQVKTFFTGICRSVERFILKINRPSTLG